MGIINTNPTPPPPPTPAQQLAAAAQNFQARINNQYQQNAGLFAQLAAFVWANNYFTPQQVFDAFGTNAADLFKCAAAFEAMVAAYTGTAPASPVPAGWAYTLNADGTVTVTGPNPAPAS